MSQPLFPVVEVPDFISEDSQYDTQYKRSMKWDPELGDFVRDGAHRIKECDGKEAFAIWCFKIAQTERYRCLAYPDSIGTEMERAMDNDDEKTVESMAERTITDGCLFDCKNEQCEVYQVKRFTESEAIKERIKIQNLNSQKGMYAGYIAALRKDAKITMMKMSQIAGCSPAEYSSYEHERKEFDPEIYRKCEKYLKEKEGGGRC